MHMDSLCKRQSALCTGPTTTLFKKNIKNESHGTIHTIKNYFATMISVFSKISCIRMDSTYFEILTIDYMVFIFSTHMLNFVIIGYYLLYDA